MHGWVVVCSAFEFAQLEIRISSISVKMKSLLGTDLCCPDLVIEGLCSLTLMKFTVFLHANMQ